MPVSLHDCEEVRNYVYGLLTKLLRFCDRTCAAIDHAVRNVVAKPVQLRKACESPTDLRLDTTVIQSEAIYGFRARHEFVVKPSHLVLKSGAFVVQEGLHLACHAEPLNDVVKIRLYVETREQDHHSAITEPRVRPVSERAIKSLPARRDQYWRMPATLWQVDPPPVLRELKPPNRPS